MMSFWTYLKRQAHRSDRVGRFAKDAMADDNAPKTSNSVNVWIKYIEKEHNADAWAIEGCREAFIEYCNLYCSRNAD